MVQAATEGKPVAPDLVSISDALKLRGDMAAGVAAGTETPADAVIRLQAQTSPTGLKLDADADFAYAAVDIGQRLIASGKPAKAEAFFQAAEISLNSVIARTADTAVHEKVQYLQARATIRANYLKKQTDGRADLDAALQLVPGDKHLQQLRRLIPADPASTFQNHPEAPSKG